MGLSRGVRTEGLLLPGGPCKESTGWGGKSRLGCAKGQKSKGGNPWALLITCPCLSCAHWQALGQHLSSTSLSSAAYKCCVPLCPLDRTWSLAVSSQRGSHITEDADFSISTHALGDFKNLSLDPAIPLLEIYRMDMEIKPKHITRIFVMAKTGEAPSLRVQWALTCTYTWAQ